MQAGKEAPKIQTFPRVFITVVALISVVQAIDFIFYRAQIRNLLGAIGFALIGWGIYRSARLAGRTGHAMADQTPIDPSGKYANAIGLAFALCSIVMKWLE